MWIWVCMVLSQAANLNAEHPESKEKETPTAEEVSSTLDKILENYDHRLRPNISEGPLIIQSDVFITGFGPVDDQKMEFTVDMFLRQRWVDPRLAFNETMNKTQSHISTLRK